LKSKRKIVSFSPVSKLVTEKMKDPKFVAKFEMLLHKSSNDVDMGIRSISYDKYATFYLEKNDDIAAKSMMYSISKLGHGLKYFFFKKGNQFHFGFSKHQCLIDALVKVINMKSSPHKKVLLGLIQGYSPERINEIAKYESGSKK
jgi:hypothetical protein